MNKVIVILQLILITSCNKSLVYREKVLYQAKNSQKQYENIYTDNKNITNGAINQNIDNNTQKDTSQIVFSEKKQSNNINYTNNANSTNSINNDKNIINSNTSYREVAQKTNKVDFSESSRQNQYDDILNKTLNNGAKPSELAVKQNNDIKYSYIPDASENKQFIQKKQLKDTAIIQPKKATILNPSNKQNNNVLNKKNYRIQCGNFKLKQTANELADKLKKYNFKEVEVVQINSGNRVLVGNFNSKDDGQQTMNDIKQSGIVNNCFFIFE